MSISAEQGYYSEVEYPLSGFETHVADPEVLEAYSAASAESNGYGTGTSVVLDSLFRVVDGVPTVNSEELECTKESWSLFLQYFLLGKNH